jgi:hypothetical protein
MDAGNGPCCFAYIPCNFKIISCNWPYYHNSFTDSLAHGPHERTVVISVDTKTPNIILIIPTRDKNSIEIVRTLNRSVLCKASDRFSRATDKSSTDFIQSIIFREHLEL